jgi:hypothetical protein
MDTVLAQILGVDGFAHCRFLSLSIFSSGSICAGDII